jgi:hypothetical protein
LKSSSSGTVISIVFNKLDLSRILSYIVCYQVEDVEGIGKDARLLEVAHVLAWHEEQAHSSGSTARATRGEGDEGGEGEGGTSLPRSCLPRLRPCLLTNVRYAHRHYSPCHSWTKVFFKHWICSALHVLYTSSALA